MTKKEQEKLKEVERAINNPHCEIFFPDDDNIPDGIIISEMNYKDARRDT